MSYKSEVIDPGDKLSKLAHQINVESYNNSPAITVVPHDPGNFRGPVGWAFSNSVLKEMMTRNVILEMENDGAGGKTQFFALLNDIEAMRFMSSEIIAMVVDDFARTGRLPLVFSNDFQIKRVTNRNYSLAEATILGFGELLKKHNLVSLTGETAIMKHSITSFFDGPGIAEEHLLSTWSGTCVGLANQKLLIDSRRIKPGMPIVGFYEPGYRCNGGTFMTNLLLRRYCQTAAPGEETVQAIRGNEEAMDFLRMLTTPSQIYASTITRIVGWLTNGNIALDGPRAKIQGIAHITGGGLWQKFGEMLPSGVGANFDNMPKPAKVLRKAQDFSMTTSDALLDHDAYSTFHGGCGMLLVADSEVDAKIIIAEAKADGIQADRVGETTTGNKIELDSKFIFGKHLTYTKE